MNNIEAYLINLLGEDWYNRIKDFLLSTEFSRIGQTVSARRKKTIVYPPVDKIFRIFKEIPFDEIQVIIIGQDPYPDGSACGHAFCNCEAIVPSKSLKYIMQEIEQEYPELTDRFEMPFGGLDKWDLGYLIKQGVFLWNVALTVEVKNPKSHLELWKPFTFRIIQELNKASFLVWLLLGKDAQAFKSVINPAHICIDADHPAYHAYSPNAKFIGSGCFRKVNFALDQNGRKEILW